MPEMTTVQRGDIVPHFQARTVSGEMFDYPSIWQRQNLVLITIPATVPGNQYARSVSDRHNEFAARNSACVVTHDRVSGLSTPTALVADRWGEIVHVVAPRDIADLPTPQDLLDWVEHLEHRCPECEGEAR